MLNDDKCLLNMTYKRETVQSIRRDYSYFKKSCVLENILEKRHHNDRTGLGMNLLSLVLKTSSSFNSHISDPLCYFHLAEYQRLGR